MVVSCEYLVRNKMGEAAETLAKWFKSGDTVCTNLRLSELYGDDMFAGKQVLVQGGVGRGGGEVCSSLGFGWSVLCCD